MNNLKTFFLIITFALFCMQCGSDDVTTNPTVNTSARNGIFFHHSTGECIWGPNGM